MSKKDFNFTPEFLTASDVAIIMHTTPDKVKNAIENHSMPVGAVFGQRCIIVKRRFERWLNGDDLNASCQS